MRNFLYLLVVSIFVLSCNRENSDVVRVQVLNDGEPVTNHFVNFSAGNPSIGDYTNGDGIATIDLNGAVIDFPESYLLFCLKPSGYTRFVDKETLHVIQVEKEEEIAVEVLSPDLENTTYQIGDEVDVQLKITSNYIPLVFRRIIINPITTDLQPIAYATENYGDNDTQPNYDGILKFTYTVHNDGDSSENTNGFRLSIPDEGYTYLDYTFKINRE